MQFNYAQVLLKVLFTAWLVFLMIFQNFFSTCLDSLSPSHLSLIVVMFSSIYICYLVGLFLSVVFCIC
ncbi:uncharacterized protein BX664DRAFT_325754, partial [Halteromyces radiatus]|uniref:uncharacterized protein n=1 Tax=Halteromyces radiatus TaxID=101107 RepID=UPI00221ED8D6